MTHMVKIDIVTGHEKIGNLQFIRKIIFHCILIETPYTVYFASLAHFLTC